MKEAFFKMAKQVNKISVNNYFKHMIPDIQSVQGVEEEKPISYSPDIDHHFKSSFM